MVDCVLKSVEPNILVTVLGAAVIPVVRVEDVAASVELEVPEVSIAEVTWYQEQWSRIQPCPS